MPKYFNAIIVCGRQVEHSAGGILDSTFLKYHNIMETRLGSFERFARTKKNALYINLYDKRTRDFVRRVYLQL